MLDHFGIRVPASKFDEVVAFYLKALAPLEYTEFKRFPGAIGLQQNHVPDFWIQATDAESVPQVHFAFQTKLNKTVNEFHAAALAAGGKDNGKPGLRPESHARYYGAFIIDPAGNNVEAVCHNDPVYEAGEGQGHWMPEDKE